MSDPELTSASRSSRFFQRHESKLLKTYLKYFPALFHICYDPIGSHKPARKAFAFLLGVLLGLFVIGFVVVDLQLGKYPTLVLAIVLIAGLSTGCVLSLQFRCICMLMIPGFFGRAGRTVLKTLVLGYIIAGPIFNLTYNAKEVMRSFACTTQLTVNLTKSRLDLMFRPFHQAMINMNESAEQLKETLSSVQELIEPIKHEIEDDDPPDNSTEPLAQEEEMREETEEKEEKEEKQEQEQPKPENSAENYEAKYRRKISARCEQQLDKGAEKCRQSFAEAYDKCFTTVTWAVAWLLCWPMKLTFACNLVQALGGRSICDPEGKIDVGLGEGYAALKETRDKLKESIHDARIEYNVRPHVLTTGVQQAARASQGVMLELEARRRFFEAVMTLLKRLLSLVCLKIAVDACRYHGRYLRDIEHDNVYVTRYFRRIDARRRARGSLTLLPLKKLERTKIVDPYSLEQSKAERRNLVGQTAKLLLEIFTASVFVLMERLFFEVLDIVRKHARVDIHQKGHHDLSVEIKGSGMVASLIRTLIRGFNSRRRIDTLLTNEACLPKPARLSRWELLRIYGTYLTVWLMLLLQAYTQRSRRAIGGFFYRKREKRRVLYLYNETLRRRIGFLGFARAKVAERARAHQLVQEPRPWLNLRLKHPELCGWLIYFGCGRFSCVVCSEVEPRHGPLHELCPTRDCIGAYCAECWRDIGERCLVCSEAESPSSASEHSPDERDDDV